MKITAVSVGMMEENCYVIELPDCFAVIDPGDEYDKIASHIKDKPCSHVLLTHAHFDHIGAVAEFARHGAEVFLHSNDVNLLNSDGHLAKLFGKKLEKFPVNRELNGGESLDIGGASVEVIATPGHTDGSVCYKIGNALFSGDTLFRLGVGRTDLPSGDARKLRDSLARVLGLSGVERVYPGHGESTTLEFEKEYNPYV